MSAPVRLGIEPIRDYLLDLQDRICSALETEEPDESFREQRFEDERGGLARPRVLEGGAVIEKAAVHFTHSIGAELPPAATARRPELAGRGFQAASVSLIVHPRNPYAPTSHMNVRFFLVGANRGDPAWWVGGGFDLTPYYGFEEDAVHWHTQARAACAPFGDDLYPELKKACDDYFFLPHRGEARGIGGIFFDDYDVGGIEGSIAFMRSVGDHYMDAYLPILRRRKDSPYGERERSFQLGRRGRYVEFNLVYDRGTKYGLQSGRRIESVLASMPPLASWSYDAKPDPGSPEAELAERFLTPRDWV
jgi:coproporphyrinogen III oxidase